MREEQMQQERELDTLINESLARLGYGE